MPHRIISFDELLTGSLAGNTSGIIVADTYHDGQVSMHSHEFYEFVYVREGFTVHNYLDNTTILTEGDIFAVSPGVFHAYTGLHYTKVFNCMFKPEAVDRVMSELIELPGLSQVFSKNPGEKKDWIRIRLLAPERIRVISVLERMLEEQKRQDVASDIILSALLLQFLGLFSRYYSEHYIANGPEKNYLSYTLKILRYIEENYNTGIDLHKMSEHIGISPDYLSRQFKKIMGISPAVFLRSYRLARAMSLIKEDPNVSLLQVSKDVGYKHLSHFSREFKAFTGVTPSEYRMTNGVC